MIIDILCTYLTSDVHVRGRRFCIPTRHAAMLLLIILLGTRIQDLASIHRRPTSSFCCFLKWGGPLKSSMFKGNYTPCILGYPHFKIPTYCSLCYSIPKLMGKPLENRAYILRNRDLENARVHIFPSNVGA